MTATPNSPEPPYENTYIGMFIYTLGLIVGHRAAVASPGSRPVLPSGVLLLQQTPKDSPVGDALTQWDGRGALLEFKRTQTGIAEEFKDKPVKAAWVTWLADLDPGDPDRQRSDRAHFLAYGVMDAGEPLAFLPYTHIHPKLAAARPSAVLGTQAFMNRLLAADNDAHALGVPMAELREYLEKLAELHAADGALDGTAGFLVNVAPGGAPRVLAYRGVQSLHRAMGTGLPAQARELRTRAPQARGGRRR